MAYTKGLLCLLPASCPGEDKCDAYDHDHTGDAPPTTSDSRGEGASYDTRRAPLAYLPHSCNLWVIGGPDEVRAMIEDLQEALAYFEAGSPPPGHGTEEQDR